MQKQMCPSRFAHAGGVLRELRDPFLHALALREAHDVEDEVDERLAAAGSAHAARPRTALLTAGDRAAAGAASLSRPEGFAVGI